VLRPYQFGPMRVPECNHKVTGNGYKAVDDDGDDDEGRINFSVALSPKTTRTHNNKLKQ